MKGGPSGILNCSKTSSSSDSDSLDASSSPVMAWS